MQIFCPPLSEQAKMQEPLDPGGTLLTHRGGADAAPFYQCIKTSLKSVVRDESVAATLQDAALRANEIITHMAVRQVRRMVLRRRAPLDRVLL
jgi:hypothetical protein